MAFLPGIRCLQIQGWMRHTLFLMMIMAVCFVLVACESDPVLGDQVVLSGTAYLECSQKCRDHGSCGIAEGSEDKVLLLGAQPAFPSVSAVEFKGLLDGNPVEVQETRIVSGVVQRTGEEVEIRFYKVERSDADISGWIPGFCLAQGE